MSILTFDKNSFYIDGEPFRIIAGDVHYFRIHPDKWEGILDLAVDFGLNTIQTYVPWNAHEPKRGEFDFSGMLDLTRFLELCHKKGLKVLLRPTPYICSEWDLGGLPAWLLKKKDITLRCSDPDYLEALEEYYDRLTPVYLPYLSTNNGPIIAVVVENEYGSYGNDHRYLKSIADMLIKRGVNVPLYTTDGPESQLLEFGREEESYFFGVNYRAKQGMSQPAEKVMHDMAICPFFVGEFWSGRSMHWGEPFYHRDPKETSEAYKEALELGGNVCFYMFCGGTNFGFMGGANYGCSYSPRENTPVRYIPHTTSYDVDALVSENGMPTEKYYLCRDVLDEDLGREDRPRADIKYETQAFTVELTETASLFDDLDALTETKSYSPGPKPMEDYDQSYGLILYTTELNGFVEPKASLALNKYRDRATVFMDNEYFATFLRDRGLTKAADGVVVSNGRPTFAQSGSKRKIDVLVENLGRLNFGKEMSDERKGMEEPVVCVNGMLFGYETRTLPLSDLSGLSWTKKSHKDHMPYFFKGTFDAKQGVDTFLDFSSLGHGYAWINGFNLGRYDSAGPQMTLFVPGGILKTKDNELILLDLAPIGDRSSIAFKRQEILEGDAVEMG